MTAHGSDSTYTNHHCRCPDCRAAHTAYLADWRSRRHPSDAYRHGDNSTYLNYACRCAECREAHRRHRAAQRRKAAISRAGAAARKAS